MLQLEGRLTRAGASGCRRGEAPRHGVARTSPSGAAVKVFLTLTLGLAPAACFSGGACVASTYRCLPRQGRCFPSRPVRAAAHRGPLHLRASAAGGGVAPFGPGLRVLSMREQRELLEQLQAASDPAAPWTDTAPTWEALDAQMLEQGDGRPLERSGVNGAARVRLFDAPAGTVPRVTFYRDSAAWCPYCHKVQLLLEEKRVPYSIEKINMRCYGDKADKFKELSPAGNLPVAEIDGAVVAESNDILHAIETTFASGFREMLPREDDPHAARVPALLQLERDLFNHWMRWLVRESVYGDDMMQTFVHLVSQVDAQLEQAAELERSRAAPGNGHVFFLGSEVSMVDCMFAPFLERMAASVPYYKGLAVRGNGRWPHLQRWFAAMETRDSFRRLQSDYYTLCHGLPPQIGRCESHPEASHSQKSSL